MHKSEGVCVVEDIRTERFSGAAPRQYYILRPQYENVSTTVFLPVDGAEKRLRALLTDQEIEQLLKQVETAPALWETNDRQRQEKFSRLLKEAEPLVLLQLLRELREHRREQAAQGKKLRFFDEHTLQECEKLICQEYAHVLKAEKNDVLKRIVNDNL